MNRSDLVALIAHKFDTTLFGAERIVGAVLDTIADLLKRGEDVSLHRFGTFEIYHKGQYRAVRFRVSKQIKEKLNKES